MLINWDAIYNYFGIRDFIYFISSPSIQDAVFPIKLVFIFFSIFFFCAIMWFYVNSSYLKYKFLQDVNEFLSRDNYGLKKFVKSWKKIKKRVDSGLESELKLAIIEADDFLYEALQDMGYQGENFEELIAKADKKIPNPDQVLEAHQLRNVIVYQPDAILDTEKSKKIISIYEAVIKKLTIA